MAFERVPGNPGYAQVVFNETFGCRCELYDFNIERNPISARASLGTMVRNVQTAVGSIVNSSYRNGFMGSGKPFLIQYNNIVKISK